METQNVASPLMENMQLLSGLQGENSARVRTGSEKRIDDAFLDYRDRLSDQRAGWKPRWTTSLRAEVWCRFARECKEFIEASGIPIPSRAFDIERIDTRFPAGYRELAALLLGLLDDPKMLAVGGPRGTGKSTLGWGLIVRFCELGRPAIYRTVKELFDELSNADWKEKQEVRNNYFRPALLVLDEIQVRDADRNWQDNELTTLIDRRYRESKATLLLSNLNPTALKENVGESIWRRLIETGGDPIEADWPSIEEVKALIEQNKRRMTAHAVAK